MILFCVIFAFGVAYIAFRGVGGTTGVNAAINVIQIVALLIFSCMAIGHRMKNPEGSNVWVQDSTGTPVQYVQDTIPDTSKKIQDPKFPNDSSAGSKLRILPPRCPRSILPALQLQFTWRLMPAERQSLWVRMPRATRS